MERGVVSGAAGAGRASSVRRKLKKDEVAVLLSVVATVVVLVQRFLAENDSLLQASHRIALESSMQATTIALSRLQMMFSVAAQVCLSSGISKSNASIAGASSTCLETKCATWSHELVGAMLVYRWVFQYRQKLQHGKLAAQEEVGSWTF